MTRTCTYCGETSPATLSSCPSCGRSFAVGQIEQVMTPPRGVSVPDGGQADGLYTRMALKAVDLSDTFNALFGQPMPGWRAEMGRPGMSTAGGRQALQHIGLRGSDGGTLVVGSVDPTAARAEIRSYRRVDAMFRERYRRPIPIRAPDWDRFAQRLVQFLKEEGIAVRVDSGAGGRDDETDALDAPPSSFPVAWVALGCLVVALIAGVVTWTLMTRPAAPVGPVLSAPMMPPGAMPAWPAPAGPPGPPLLPPLPPRIAPPPFAPPPLAPPPIVPPAPGP